MNTTQQYFFDMMERLDAVTPKPRTFENYEPITLSGERFFKYLNANGCRFDVYTNRVIDKDRGVILLNTNYFTLHVSPDTLPEISNPDTAAETLQSLTVTIFPYTGPFMDFRTTGQLVDPRSFKHAK